MKEGTGSNHLAHSLVAFSFFSMISYDLLRRGYDISRFCMHARSSSYEDFEAASQIIVIADVLLLILPHSRHIYLFTNTLFFLLYKFILFNFHSLAFRWKTATFVCCCCCRLVCIAHFLLFASWFDMQMHFAWIMAEPSTTYTCKLGFDMKERKRRKKCRIGARNLAESDGYVRI